jgi:MFS family permease
VRRDVTLYWWGQTISAFGTVFTAIAVPVIAIVSFHASAGQVGLVSAAASLPMLLFGLPAGALADRIARPRRTLIAVDTLAALAVGLLALGIVTGIANIGWLIVLALVQGSLGTLESLVYFTHLGQLVRDQEITTVRARLQAGSYGAALLGRILAGPAIVLLGAAAALATDAASYVVSALTLIGMRSIAVVDRPDAPSGSTALAALREAAGGLVFFATDRFGRFLLMFIVVPAGAVAAVGALTGPFLLRDLRLPAAAYGLVYALSGLTGLLGSLAAGRVLRPSVDPKVAVMASFTASIACTMLLPLSTGPLALAAACAALGIALPIFFGAIANVALTSVFVSAVPEDAQGRAMAAIQVSAAGAGLAGALAAGYLGDRIGVRAALWAVGLLAAGSLALLTMPALRAARPSQASVTGDVVLAAASNAGDLG